MIACWALTLSQNSIVTVVDFNRVGNTKVDESINTTGSLAEFPSFLEGSMAQDIEGPGKCTLSKLFNFGLLINITIYILSCDRYTRVICPCIAFKSNPIIANQHPFSLITTQRLCSKQMDQSASINVLKWAVHGKFRKVLKLAVTHHHP